MVALMFQKILKIKLKFKKLKNLKFIRDNLLAPGHYLHTAAICPNFDRTQIVTTDK